MKEKIWQIIKFLMVGVSNTLISEGVYALLVCFGCHYLLASFAGFTVSIFSAYLLSSRFVFKENPDGEKRVWWKVLLKTYAAYIVGFLLNLGLLSLWMEVLDLENRIDFIMTVIKQIGISNADNHVVAELIAEGVNLFIVTPINYVLNKYWAYRQKKTE